MSAQLKQLTANGTKVLIKEFCQLENPPTVMLFGDPGIGKSFAIKEATLEAGRVYIPISLGRIEPYDIKGIPDVSGEYTKWKLPWFWKQVIDAKGKAVVHCDEATLASDDVQGAILDVIWQKTIDDTQLPEGTLFVLSGNMGGEDGTFARAFSSALTGGRGFMYAMRTPDVEEWIEYQKPLDFIASFVKHFETKVFYVAARKDATFEPWSNPRGWSQLDGICKQLKLTDPARDCDRIVDLAKGILSPTTVNLFIDELGDKIINPSGLWKMDTAAWKQYTKNASNPLKKKNALNDVLDIVMPAKTILATKEAREKLAKEMEIFLDKVVDMEKTVEIVTSFIREFGKRQPMVFDLVSIKGQKVSKYCDQLMKEEVKKSAK